MTTIHPPLAIVTAALVTSLLPAKAQENSHPTAFDTAQDLISLHYDHAPDKDDGHSAAADRTVLESLYGKNWLKSHVLALSGAYGTNAKTFNPKSDDVMNTVWNDSAGWLDAHKQKEESITATTKRWMQTLDRGGDVWVKEGGQSDITAEVVKRIQSTRKNIDTKTRIHVVQHSDWNEKHTTKAALDYVKRETNYIRIKDANRYLNLKGGNQTFAEAASSHPVFGPSWKSAWKYYDPKERIDFSDTGELFHILGLGEIGIDEFRKKFLDR